MSKTATDVKAKMTPKVSKKVAPEPVVPVPAPAPVVEVPAVVAPTSVKTLTTLHDKVKALQTLLTASLRELAHEVVEVSKTVRRDARAVKRHRKKPEDMTPEELVKYEARRKNNAFNKPRQLTPDICVFLGLPVGSSLCQTDVTKSISKYVKEHNCEDPAFRRRILPDQKLAKLLRVKDGEEVTYLNLQKFLKVHFIKPAVVA